VQKLIGKISDRRIKTFGFNAQSDVKAVNLKYIKGEAHFDVKFQKENFTIKGCVLPMPGDYNVLNALGAVAVAHHLGLDGNKIRSALASFKGVNRRFTKVGEVNGITFIDDYGHHPVEISSVLRAARQISSGRIIAVHQPHRFTRLNVLFKDFCSCFNDADIVAIADVYSAGEEKIPGVSRDDLVSGLLRHGHRHAISVSNLEELSEIVTDNAKSGDVVICLGAGSISSWASALPKLLHDGC
jgi:UDP-N-acetylmuramate--alanine ligase